MATSEASVRRSEALWGMAVAGFVALIAAATLFAALSLHRNPPSNLERIDPKTLHLTGEFTEGNLGTRFENGQVVVRLVMTQFVFAPSCVLVPKGQPVT